MVTIKELQQELEQEAQATRRVLERVPGDRLEWRPHPKSMSLGQLAMHVATLPGALAELAMQDGFDIGTEIPRPGASSTAELLERHEHSIAAAKAALAGMDPPTLDALWTMKQGDQVLWTIPRRAFLRSVLFNHWYHHRGQLTVYLRQTGAMVPATYGDSADEKPAPPKAKSGS
jgi:uncharacterized damage-inducible protein DinB